MSVRNALLAKLSLTLTILVTGTTGCFEERAGGGLFGALCKTTDCEEELATADLTVSIVGMNNNNREIELEVTSNLDISGDVTLLANGKEFKTITFGESSVVRTTYEVTGPGELSFTAKAKGFTLGELKAATTELKCCQATSLVLTKVPALEANGKPTIVVHARVEDGDSDVLWNQEVVLTINGEKVTVSMEQGQGTLQLDREAGTYTVAVDPASSNEVPSTPIEVEVVNPNAPQAPLLGFGFPASMGHEGVPHQVLVVLDKAAEEDVTATVVLELETADASEVILVDTLVSIPAGQTSDLVGLDLPSDSVVESAESFRLRLSSPQGATLGLDIHQVTLVDAGFPAQVNFAEGLAQVSRTEGETQDLVIELNKTSTTTHTVNLLVRAGSTAGASDYSLSAQAVTFQPGETTATVSMSILSDSVIEESEYVELELSTSDLVRGNRAVARIDIADDTAAQLSLVLSGMNVMTADDENLIRIEAQNADGSVNTEFDNTGIVIEHNTGIHTFFTGYNQSSRPLIFTDGVAIVGLRSWHTSSFQVSLREDTLSGLTSNTLEVTVIPGALSTLYFSGPPSYTAGDQMLASFEVLLQDGYANFIGEGSGTVEITITSGPQGGLILQPTGRLTNGRLHHPVIPMAPGLYTLEISYDELSLTQEVEVAPGVPNALELAPLPGQFPTVGDTMQLRTNLRSEWGDPMVDGNTLSFTLVSGPEGGITLPANQVPSTSPLSSSIEILAEGTYVIQAQWGELTATTQITARSSANTAAELVVTGAGTVSVGSAIPLVLGVINSNGDPVVAQGSANIFVPTVEGIELLPPSGKQLGEFDEHGYAQIQVNGLSEGIHPIIMSFEEITIQHNVTVVAATPRVVSFDGIVGSSAIPEGTVVDMGITLSPAPAVLTHVEVSVNSSASSATQGMDFILPNPTVSFLPGQTNGVVRVEILSDLEFEGEERLTLTLTPPEGVVPGQHMSQTITITDIEILPMVSFTTASVIAQEGSQAMITVEVSNAQPQDITLALSNAPGSADFNDYGAIPPVVIPAGQTFAHIFVDIYADAVVEPSEHFSLFIAHVTSGNATIDVSRQMVLVEILDPGLNQ